MEMAIRIINRALLTFVRAGFAQLARNGFRRLSARNELVSLG